MVNYYFARSYLKTIVLLVVLSVCFKTAVAQTMSDKSSPLVATAAGNPLKVTYYSDYVGSPFFNVDWVKANIMFRTGTVIQDTLVKYCDLKDQLYTQGKGDMYGLFNNTVIAFTIFNPNGTLSHFSVFPGNGKFADGAFFEILCDGDVKLLKKNVKTISENKADISTAVFSRIIVDNIDYYILINNKVVRIKKDLKSVVPIFKDKQKELYSYVQTNKLNLKNEADLIKLVNYYNTL